MLVLNVCLLCRTRHSRHSYSVELYAKENNLRAVQKQLEHSSIQNTQIYADVTKESIQEQIQNFW
ncbi:MAG: tyrosine-type recombinase/integrase [Desulfobacula sp.]|uniref:tyrosine-type recombinase/integrase n=1 Tax=Desulfobacula sp. TaxID=2593537 RepID=UPI0025C3294D|nr:tyrosine-type recombinase/integrase [Desulfobacula sp.]MCD4723070.1 tyrosine-type recombinase/integrase [Desulfobacula sp.]